MDQIGISKDEKWLSYEPSNARSVATLGAGKYKYNDGAGLLFHKRKDGGAQWIYRGTKEHST
ncbi:hypothetical protein [Bartonella raoultii]|uniref:hypothetical protein n=1 Tax=Bartonella raoultii TaxID=1457020 RepID=UPI001ABB06B7|nr:hypothetical protein [Bartonella raoultii]